MRFRLVSMLIVLAINSYSYNYAIRYKNDGVDKYSLEGINDCFGFSFSNFFDDLRTNAELFTYESKYNFIINAEIHMLTFRGYKDDPEEVRRRADLIEVGFMYYVPFVIKPDITSFGEIHVGIGIKNLIYGNWAGATVQRGIHAIQGLLRPIPEAYDQYDYRGYLSTSLNYSYLRFLNFENYLDLSYFADYFIKTSIGVDFKNEAVGVELQLYYQAQSKIKDMATYSKVQEAESGIGMQQRIYSGNFFATTNLNLHNFSDSEQLFSVGGFGVMYTAEYESITEDALYILTPDFSISYEIMIPLQVRHLIYYQILSDLEYYFAITVNHDMYDFKRSSQTNRFSSGIAYAPCSKGIFTFYIGAGMYLSYNKDNKDIGAIYRPSKMSNTFQLGFEFEPGILLKMFRYNKVLYSLKLFTKINYSPMVYDIEIKALDKHRYTFNYFGIGLDMQP
ncbi:hypothetical protein [Candidatus Borreliella tachyglossi]|uniref:hypothetical protein n=1 Tax=Candidatus Borreliella tachyglossi TaxID=1964448 RepID=UPI0018FF7D31|nr:hypothetical protein [Candidatus Borreliella tachyglossi]